MCENRDWYSAAAVTAVALGADYVSGRAMAAFYAQLGGISWLGISVSALLFGMFTALFAALARRTGARSMQELLRRMPGGGMGRCVEALYLIIVAAAACMMVSSAARIGELVLPVRHAKLLAGGLCLLVSAAIAASGGHALQALSGAFLICAALFAAALLLSGKTDASVMRWAVDLRLRNSWGAAVLFAALHASAGVCMAAGALVRFTDGRTRAVRLGSRAALLQLVMLGLGNAAARRHAEEALVLKLPFVALASGWGRAGFCISAGLVFLASAVTLAGLLYAVFPKRKCPDFIEK